MAIREKVSVTEFHKIASTHENYIWHFLQKKQNTSIITLFSYFDEHENPMTINATKEVFDKIDIPYFESYTEDSVDFLMDLGFPIDSIYKPIYNNPIAKFSTRNFWYNPIIVSFNKFKMVNSTKKVCYCVEGLIEIIMELNPEYVLKSNFD